MTVRALTSLAVAALLAACATTAARTNSAATEASADTSGLNYALRAQYRDSVERAQLAAFFAEYNGARSIALAQSGNVLGELLLLRELAAKYPASEGVQSLTRQQIGTYLSFLGDDQGALQLFDAGEEDPAPAGASEPVSGSVLDAVDAIVSMADTARAIFVNEAHHVPRQRALTLALLPHLWAKGFRYLAADTLNALDSSLNERGYPTRESGFYSKEPVFGELLRTAQRIGFTLVPYEASGGRSQDEREHGQARNLNERILAKDPGARILVHAGYAHINESGLIAGAKPMALRFREITGIDPVTVEQTVMRERGRPALEHPHYRRVAARAVGESPFVLRDSAGGFWSARPGRNDITVITPPTVMRSGRPGWLWSVGTRQAVTLPAGFCGGANPCVVTARHEAESAGAVPVDAMLWRGAPVGPLVLPAGRYRVQARDSVAVVVRDTFVTVGRTSR